MRKLILQESEKSEIRKMYGLINEDEFKSPEQNKEFMDWVDTITISAFVAPNPYKSGILKLGVKMSPYISSNDSFYQNAANIIEQLNIVTEDGKVVYQQINVGTMLFNQDDENKEILNDGIVFYYPNDEYSEAVKSIKNHTNTNKINQFIVTVTPKPSDNVSIKRINIFKTKPATLIVQ